MARFSHSSHGVRVNVGPRPARSFDPEFIELVERCMRLSRENAALQEQVERLEAKLEDHARDEQARQRADRDEAGLQMAALKGDAAEQLGWSRT